MKHWKKLVLLSAATLAACSEIPQEAYLNRGGPESLLDISAERVTLSLNQTNIEQTLADWINQDQPTRMELSCIEGDAKCDQALDVARQFAVPVETVGGSHGEAVLIYERVTTRECDPRYLSNHINPYNLNSPSFGCSLASNGLSVISDKQQLIAPSLMDPQDGEQLDSVMKTYRTGNEESRFEFEDIFEFKGDSGTGG